MTMYRGRCPCCSAPIQVSVVRKEYSSDTNACEREPHVRKAMPAKVTRMTSLMGKFDKLMSKFSDTIENIFGPRKGK